MQSTSPKICPSCCLACTNGRLHNDETYRGPYSLKNFAAAGTIAVGLNSEDQEVECNHIHAEDGWHIFSGKVFDQSLSVSEPFYQEVDFLIQHSFIAVTYRFGSSATVFLRIYIIPHDLSNVKGKLRIRKEFILAPARRYMKKLLPLISQNVDHWDGLFSANPVPPTDKDRRTLAEIYGSLCSPQPGLTPGWESITGRLLNFDDDLSGLGLRSTLYNYQRRSVAAMMQRELDLGDLLDPLFIPLVSMTGESLYLQPGTMEILQERPTVAATRSGILCEELGTGKTVMTLALILATINQISSPEQSIVDDRPVLTPLSFRYFPSAQAGASRKRFFRGCESRFPTQGSGVPSLVELLLDRIRTTPDLSIPNLTDARRIERHRKRVMIAEEVERIRPGELLKANIPFYFHYDGEQIIKGRIKRKTVDPGPRIVYLTSATLIVVPVNLLSQWDREIQKHCNYPVRVLILRSGTPMPHVSSLASDHDIVLMTYKRFTTENSYNNKEKLCSWDICRCPEFSEARIPDCKCQFTGVSPLLQIRWKRLVIDEGHACASLSSILTPFTKALSVERRWVVTGTPTTNLLGLGLGKKTNENPNSPGEESDSSTSESDFDDVTNRAPFFTIINSSQADDVPPRIWNKYNREDLNKLGKMITHFVSIPHFNSNPKLVTTHIIDPLLDPQGPRPGAIQVLNQVMQMAMIRHRIEDVEDEVVLPPVMHTSILLDLEPYARKSYNAMQATIAINAVDSQRTDQDYLFHPRNAEFLQTLVKNMSQIMFWSSDDSLYNVDELSRNANEHIKRALERNMPEEDIILLRDAFKHAQLAAEDELWRTMNSHEDVPYRIHGLQKTIFDAWTRTPQQENSYDGFQTGFLHADRLLKMQNAVVRRPRILEGVLIDLGLTTAREDMRIREIYLKSQKSKNKRSTHKSGKHEEAAPSLLAEDVAKKARDPGTLEEMRKDLDTAMARLSGLDGEDGDVTPPSPPAQVLEYHGSTHLSSSLLGQVRLGCTASSKLNYIMNEVLQYSQTEKFLIFSDSALTLAHISEALQLMHVKFLRFTTQVEARVREQVVLTFETSETYRVFLMELKHGARGLNLISASRVIFCEPVWQADVESQAIKRAHRIGQVKPITVKTLAIRGTAEETMVTRRDALKSSQAKIPKLIEEAGMRHFIANPKFIDYPPERYSTVDIPLLRIRPTDSDDSQAASTPTASPQKRIRPVEPISIIDLEPPRKRVVRFE